MKISIIPASTQAGKATIEALLASEDPPQIQAIYRNVSKTPAEFRARPSFHAVEGGLDGGMNLDFGESDAVLYVPPPTYDEAIDTEEHASRTALKVKAALQSAPNVRRLVLLSALGAQHPSGIGTLKINHITDKILADSVPEVVIARPGWFYENWSQALESAQSDVPFFESYFTPVDQPITMVSLEDVGKILAKQLAAARTALPLGPHVISLRGPRNYSMLDLQSALEIVTRRKPRVDAVPPDELLEYYGRKLGPLKAHEVAEMTRAINGGGLLAAEMATPDTEADVVRGHTELVETLHRLAEGKVSKCASGAF